MIILVAGVEKLLEKEIFTILDENPLLSPRSVSKADGNDDKPILDPIAIEEMNKYLDSSNPSYAIARLCYEVVLFFGGVEIMVLRYLRVSKWDIKASVRRMAETVIWLNSGYEIRELVKNQIQRRKKLIVSSLVSDIKNYSSRDPPFSELQIAVDQCYFLYKKP
jgi:hypothetical protein